MTKSTPNAFGMSAAAVLGLCLSGMGAAAQGLPVAKQLPLGLASEAAAEAVAVCARSGYQVTATVVDADGLVKAVARGDLAPPHTLDSSRGKAFAAVSLGPNFRLDTTSAIVGLVGTSTAFVPLATLPGVYLVAGGVILKSGNEVVGAIGVGGSPGGDKDEVCAQAAAAKIASRLE